MRQYYWFRCKLNNEVEISCYVDLGMAWPLELHGFLELGLSDGVMVPWEWYPIGGMVILGVKKIFPVSFLLLWPAHCGSYNHSG